MRQIDEKIRWLERNSTRKDDDLVRVKLKMINELYKEIECSEDKIFIDEIIETFLGIMDIQREVICDLQMENEPWAGYVPVRPNFLAAHTQPEGGFQNDKQLQTAFSAYLAGTGKSSYTINDYCCRIRNLWKSFHQDYQEGKLPEKLRMEEVDFLPEQPLVNAFNFNDELFAYISIKMTNAENKRSLANTQAAIRRFDDFKRSLI